MTTTTRDEIEGFCEAVGSDPLLTQAAGGNVSWKDENTLWVKSSGAWLENARREDMFVPVDLAAIRTSIDAGNENYVEHRLAGSNLRPSIETALHALLPQPVVAHLHAVDALAYSVMRDGYDRLLATLDGIDWLWIPYRKPGARLASEVSARLCERSVAPDLLILGNHGAVFCAASVAALEALVADVTERLRLPVRTVDAPDVCPQLRGYRPARRRETRALAFDPIGIELAMRRWVLYPDHAVFLGPAAHIAATLTDAEGTIDEAVDRRARPCAIVPDSGVWLADGTSEAAERMLDCYVDVCRRVDGADAVVALAAPDIAALLNWEAETFRKQLAR